MDEKFAIRLAVERLVAVIQPAPLAVLVVEIDPPLIDDRLAEAHFEQCVAPPLLTPLRGIGPERMHIEADRLAGLTGGALGAIEKHARTAIAIGEPLVELFGRESLDRMSVRKPSGPPRQIRARVERIEDDDFVVRGRVHEWNEMHHALQHSQES
jgi:hypothetical protein